jgi:hypothetical protein
VNGHATSGDRPCVGQGQLENVAWHGTSEGGGATRNDLAAQPRRSV